MSENPHTPQPNEQPSVRGRLLASGVSFLASTGVLAPPALAVTPPVHPNGGVESIMKLGASNAELPKSVERDMARNTVYLSGLRCSGRAIRGKDGEVIGVITAQHCSLQNGDNERIQGSDNRFYIVQPKQVKAQVGAELHHLKTVAKINQFILPNSDDTSHDIALGVAEGHTPAEVSQAYQDSSLSPKQIANLSAGQTVFWAGWPTYQPKSGLKGMERQEFKMSATALGYGNTTKTKDVKLLWANVEASNDGANCSFGASGSEGFVMIAGKIKSVGTLSEFNDYTGKVPGTFSSTPVSAPTLQLKHGNVSASCGFAFEAVQLSKNAMVVRSVRSTKEIPGYKSPEQAVESFRKKLHDPSFQRSELNGVISMPAVKGGPIVGEDPITLISNPILEHDSQAHGMVIGYADPTEPDHLAFSFMSDRFLDTLAIFSHDPNAENVDIVQSSGPVEYSADPTGESTGYISDNKLGQIGAVETKVPDVPGPVFTLGVQGDKLVVFKSAPGMK